MHIHIMHIFRSTYYFQFLVAKRAVMEALVVPRAGEKVVYKATHVTGWLRSEIYFTQRVPTFSPPMQR